MQYQLKGKNVNDGQLVLDEFTNGTESATLFLSKSTENGKVVWSGRLQNTDSGSLIVSISRNNSQ